MAIFDDILEQTGKFGWFQLRTYLIVCVPTLVACLMAFVQVFIAGNGDHWCKVSQWEHEDCSQWNLTESECTVLKRNLSAPVFDKDDKRNPQCMKYNLSEIDLTTAFENREQIKQLDIIKCDEGWNFDKSLYPSTITEDWELVCDKSFIPSLLQSVYLAGFLLGCLMFGAMADRFGRYYTFLIANISAGVLGILGTLSPNYIVFGILRFLLASCAYGSLLVGFVLGTEIVLPEKRVYVGVVLWYFFAVGYFVLSGLARVVPSWRVLLAMFAIPYFFIMPAFLILTESPRWLINRNDDQAADKVINKIAQVNGTKVPRELINKLSEEKRGDNLKPASLWAVFRCPTLLGYLANLWYNWFVQSFLYYGLSLGTSSLGVNVYIAFCISGAVEIPAYTASIFTMKKFGRKISTAVLMIIAGLSCFATIFAPLGAIRVTVAMMGKFAISASFSNIYVHTVEIFPTPLRTLSVGACSVAARIGGIIAPLILVLNRVWEPLPLVLFAASSVLAGLLVFFLPETKGKQMPDTIEDSLNLKHASCKHIPTEETAPVNI